MEADARQGPSSSSSVRSRNMAVIRGRNTSPRAEGQKPFAPYRLHVQASLAEPARLNGHRPAWVQNRRLGVRTLGSDLTVSTACADREIRWSDSSGSAGKLMPLPAETCAMEGAGPFIGLTGPLAEGLRSAPAICHSNSRAVYPAIRVSAEHDSEVELPELAGFLSLVLRQIPYTGY